MTRLDQSRVSENIWWIITGAIILILVRNLWGCIQIMWIILIWQLFIYLSCRQWFTYVKCYHLSFNELKLCEKAIFLCLADLLPRSNRSSFPKKRRDHVANVKDEISEAITHVWQKTKHRSYNEQHDDKSLTHLQDFREQYFLSPANSNQQCSKGFSFEIW